MTMDEYEREIRRRVWRRRVRAATRAVCGGPADDHTGWRDLLAVAAATALVAAMFWLAVLVTPPQPSGEADWAIAEEARLSGASAAE